MQRRFTFRLFTTKKLTELTQNEQNIIVLKAPEKKVDFIKSFARSYEVLNLKTCTEQEFVKN